MSSHLVVKDLGLASLGLGDEGLVKNVENILANSLQLIFNLLAVITDDGDMLLGALGFLLLFDGGDDTPGGTTGTDHILIRDREKVTFINSEFTTNLNQKKKEQLGR